MEIEKKKTELNTHLSAFNLPAINDIPTLIDSIINVGSDYYEWYWYLFVDKTWHYKGRMARRLGNMPEEANSYLQKCANQFPNATMILYVPLVKILVLEGSVFNRYDPDFDVEFPNNHDIRIGEVMERYKIKKGKRKWK